MLSLLSCVTFFATESSGKSDPESLDSTGTCELICSTEWHRKSKAGSSSDRPCDSEGSPTVGDLWCVYLIQSAPLSK